ncbi:malonyl-ACP O-methyltransferase BioC [Marinihelvus fidelis]|uniref:Malonyl-[acyl-carrier protein] O-methyltransferase n=1 Tax=Marinihelvus fidelis TaxID=2613842 RepID=A0A5N0T8L5_9GAMM|nr:malonyl-ACP O-methyltransferase BioC [Marinihelvus fidelis]KAA9131365.1 malonyl-ACP O-methyltransferase BioC [Marinihelvus fidelis]
MTLTDIDKAAARRAFDRAAPHYDAHAALQQEVESRLFERLDYFQVSPERVIDLGCGTGAGAHILARRHPQAMVLALDWAPGMLAQLHRRPQGNNRPAPVCADMQALPVASRSVDLVFSSLAVQWSNHEVGLFAEVRRVLRPGGLFLFSSLGPDTLMELRQAWAEVDEGRHVHRFADMHDVGDALVSAGFRDPVMDAETLMLEYGDPIGVMRDLKGTGAVNAARDRAGGLTAPGKLRRVTDAYRRFGRDGRFPASYEVIYGAAFGPAEGQPVRQGDMEVATFSVEALKRGCDGPSGREP